MTYTLGGGMSEEDAAETCRGRVGRAGLATPPGPAGRMIVVPAERSEGAGSFPTWGRNKVRNILPCYHHRHCVLTWSREGGMTPSMVSSLVARLCWR